MAYGREALGRDAEIEFSAEDASRTDIDYLIQVYAAVVEAGASTVNIPDTVGYAIPAEFGVARRAGRRPRRARRHRQRPLPQRPGARDGQHARRGPGRRPPGRGDDQRPRRASRQRVARRGRDGPPDPADAVPGARPRVQTEQITRREPPGQLPDRVRDPAEQGDRRRQRVRPRVGHPPGRRDQEPADLRDHDPPVGRAVRQPADDRQAVRPARPPAEAEGLGHEVEGEALDEIYRQAIALADAKKEVTDDDLLALVEQRAAEVPASVELVGWSVTSSHGGKATGTVTLIVDGEERRPSPPATGRSTRCSRRSTRPSSRSSAGTRR